MIAIVDVDYRADRVVTASVEIEAWTYSVPAADRVLVSREAPAAYKPGRFWERELPYLIEILSPLPDLVVVDNRMPPTAACR